VIPRSLTSLAYTLVGDIKKNVIKYARKQKIKIALLPPMLPLFIIIFAAFNPFLGFIKYGFEHLR
jgi:hypothetical protein